MRPKLCTYFRFPVSVGVLQLEESDLPHSRDSSSPSFWTLCYLQSYKVSSSGLMWRQRLGIVLPTQVLMSHVQSWSVNNGPLLTRHSIPQTEQRMWKGSFWWEMWEAERRKLETIQRADVTWWDQTKACRFNHVLNSGPCVSARDGCLLYFVGWWAETHQFQYP